MVLFAPTLHQMLHLTLMGAGEITNLATSILLQSTHRETPCQLEMLTRDLILLLTEVLPETVIPNNGNREIGTQGAVITIVQARHSRATPTLHWTEDQTGEHRHQGMATATDRILSPNCFLLNPPSCSNVNQEWRNYCRILVHKFWSG